MFNYSNIDGRIVKQIYSSTIKHKNSSITATMEKIANNTEIKLRFIGFLSRTYWKHVNNSK